MSTRDRVSLFSRLALVCLNRLLAVKVAIMGLFSARDREINREFAAIDARRDAIEEQLAAMRRHLGMPEKPSVPPRSSGLIPRIESA